MKKTFSDQELYAAVEKTIRSVFRVNGADIQPTTKLVGDLAAESIDFLDFGLDLEKIVDAEVDFRKMFQEKRAKSDAAQLDVTVQEVVDYLKTLIDSQNLVAEAVAQ